MSRRFGIETWALAYGLVDLQIAQLVRVTAYAAFDVRVAQAILRAQRDDLVNAMVVAMDAPSVLLPAAAGAVTEAIAHHAGPLH
jgi:hypothetical protein